MQDVLATWSAVRATGRGRAAPVSMRQVHTNGMYGATPNSLDSRRSVNSEAEQVARVCRMQPRALYNDSSFLAQRQLSAATARKHAQSKREKKRQSKGDRRRLRAAQAQQGLFDDSATESDLSLAADSLATESTLDGSGSPAGRRGGGRRAAEATASVAAPVAGQQWLGEHHMPAIAEEVRLRGLFAAC